MVNLDKKVGAVLAQEDGIGRSDGKGQQGGLGGPEHGQQHHTP
jgi:hypothetical protein